MTIKPLAQLLNLNGFSAQGARAEPDLESKRNYRSLCQHNELIRNNVKTHTYLNHQSVDQSKLLFRNVRKTG